ncbi:class II glutamine amidotransferase [Janthinobacterium sp. hw3]|uniref:Class II glutamine amidotransferase n=2 Tax=Janthinobacterium fluminis TaxID=2987524 RepID=A0ABT5JVL5_9BURK|nr:class II glutamine amidotransferase [Janthinobacterium fluminis]MDC8756465.1 class II glutamine amidotransferase [Janthinobacterium fluminis]
MCQLLAMNSSKPAALAFSFEGFAERGGRTGEHKDGWGIAFHASDGCRLYTDHLASVDSPLAATIRQHPVKAKNIVAHIRKATQGRIAPENTHPFTRELWGKTWSFAHNGDLKNWRAPAGGNYAARGDTDSEQAFCHLLAGLRQRFPDGQPDRAALFAAIDTLGAHIAAHGSFNFILSDGDTLFARCSTSLHYVVRAYPFTEAKLIDCELSIDFRRHNHLDDRIAVIATEPLTSNEQWRAFAPGELKMFSGGEEVAPGAEKAWRWQIC